MKFRRPGRKQTDQESLIEEKNEQEEEQHHHQRSKVRRTAWKLAKRTWKALKIGFKAAAASQGFICTLEPTAVATTIVEYQVQRRDERRRQYN